MRVRKEELAMAVRRRMSELGAKSQPAMAALLKRDGIRISQPTLSRLLAGEYIGVPRSLSRLCKYAGISLNSFFVQIDPAESVQLMRALRSAWDGSPHKEEFLAKVIRAAGKLARE